VDSKVSDVARIIAGVVKLRFCSISVNGTVLPNEDLFADYFEPDEVLQLDALPGQRPGVIPLEGEYTSLHKAAYEGNVAVISTFATPPEFINAKSAEGWTPAWCAAANGRVEALEALFKLGADVNLQDKNGWTPVCVAAERGHVEAVKALASHGADVTIPNNSGWTPIFIAVWNDRLDVVKRLASLGVNVAIARHDWGTPIFAAARLGRLEMVKALASLGASVSSSNKDGWTPLHAAAGCPSAAVCAFLLASGADAGARDVRGRTPADFAFAVRNQEVSALFDPTATVVKVTGRPCLKCGAPTHLCLMSGCSCDSCAATDIPELHFACRPCDVDFCASCAPPPS
jgi:hypothetical protein